VTLYGFCLELDDGTTIEGAGWGSDVDEAFMYLDVPICWEALENGQYEFEYCALAEWFGPHIVYWMPVAHD
tara:strand:+ start:1088 stop:1300 length:213 start_codon:yes stop_codon:yes gene_type:complete